MWRHGAMAARLTPDQKVGSSNLSAVIFPILEIRIAKLPWPPCLQRGKCKRYDFPNVETLILS